ncbi:undecaprenyldiphospho-muramoylpentapeptide beta-N-acetylglucosaminyltransferase [candidate division KSB1 bacterium]|nr:undecaprenyldiphospho-muramoylpentapeptide beta-N-acetylglucosaminyltransferase [candidate division KSB1 bacterium]
MSLRYRSREKRRRANTFHENTREEEKLSEGIKVAVAGGGTGGHLYPAIAIVKEIEQRFEKAEILFFGTAKGIEAKQIPQMGYRLKLIWLKGVQRKLTFKNLLIPAQLVISFYQCLFTLRRFKPDVVIGTGGYVSGPVLLIAALLGYPTVIQEQNSFPGVSTRLLSRFVDQVHLSFEESEKYFENKSKLYFSGNPIRSNLKTVAREKAISAFGLDADKKTLLIFGGSQGAHSLNQGMIRILDILSKMPNWQIIWGSGERDYEEVQRACRNYEKQTTVKPFITDMASAYSAADLVISRAGATTLAELQDCGLPALLVPYPYAAEGHQEANARTLMKQNAAEMILDRDLRSRQFVDTVLELMKDDSKRQKLGENLKSLAKPDAAENIVNDIMNLLYDA